MFGELFSKYQPGTNNRNFSCLIVILRQLQAVTPCSTLSPTPTVCYSGPSIVEVSGGCQSVNIYVCTNEGLQ